MFGFKKSKGKRNIRKKDDDQDDTATDEGAGAADIIRRVTVTETKAPTPKAATTPSLSFGVDANSEAIETKKLSSGHELDGINEGSVLRGDTEERGYSKEDLAALASESHHRKPAPVDVAAAPYPFASEGIPDAHEIYMAKQLRRQRQAAGPVGMDVDEGDGSEPGFHGDGDRDFISLSDGFTSSKIRGSQIDSHLDDGAVAEGEDELDAVIVDKNERAEFNRTARRAKEESIEQAQDEDEPSDWEKEQLRNAGFASAALRQPRGGGRSHDLPKDEGGFEYDETLLSFLLGQEKNQLAIEQDRLQATQAELSATKEALATIVKHIAEAQGQAAIAPKYDQIFAGVAFYINGYTQPSHYELKLLLVERSGRFLHYLSKSQVTHIITTGLTMSKEKEFRKYKVVRPEWVVDSVRARKLLSWQNYSIFNGSCTEFTPIMPPVLDDIGEFDYLNGSPPVGDLLDNVQPQGYSKPPPAPMNNVPSATSFRRPAPVPVNAMVVDRFDEGLNRSWVRKNLVTNKDFISRYYASSRLHHMSIWKAEMKDYVAQLNRKRGVPPSVRDAEPRSALNHGHTIMHVDFDCFFVSASLLLHPQLVGKPVAVCHVQQPELSDDRDHGAKENPGGTSQIASCNYLARSFGVKNGMFMAQASQLCPSLATVPYEFDTYKRVSKTFYDIVTEIADETQAVSIDEALLDVTHVVQQLYQGNAEALAQDIRRRVLEATKCTASVGIGPSILLARIATTRAKPDGVHSLDAEQFLALDLHTRDLPGIGRAVEEGLTTQGIRRVADIRAASMSLLQSIYGEKTAVTLHNFSRGIDDRALEPDKPRKMFGAEIGWGVRLSNQHEADDFVTRLAEEVCRSMEAAKRVGGAVTLKIKKRQEGQGKPGKFLGHGICDSLSKSAMLPGMTSDYAKIALVCVKLLAQMNVDPLDIRAVGIQVHRLASLESRPDVGDMLTKLRAGPGGGVKQSPSLVSELPSASQLDLSVVSELPESIRQELQAAYLQINPKIDLGLNSGSRSAGISPHDRASSSRAAVSKRPVGGIGATRGQPRKLAFPTARPKNVVEKATLIDAFRKIETLDSIMPSQMDSDVWGHLPLNIRRELTREYVKTRDPKTAVAVAASAPKGKEADADALGPRLFGKHDIADVRALIEAWVNSSELGPLSEDVDEFGDYVEALVKHRNLLKAEDALKYLRFCIDGKHVAWADALTVVLGRASVICMSMYSSIFDL
ncbi:deoxycytidyl transferase [Coemansia spiralis]|uniref:DNA repair protein REV1 n=1 Tax=Coemansia spiralis TaxID=417178 RepID=A0A9W8GAI1_9FUNG|nr:deoxycytidyl transferase [Coemansia spiralis]